MFSIFCLLTICVVCIYASEQMHTNTQLWETQTIERVCFLNSHACFLAHSRARPLTRLTFIPQSQMKLYYVSTIFAFKCECFPFFLVGFFSPFVTLTFVLWCLWCFTESWFVHHFPFTLSLCSSSVSFLPLLLATHAPCYHSAIFVFIVSSFRIF